ncbi:hypothetical protein EMIT043CA1_110070 [Pseudomonas brassicacearum]
MSGQPGRRNRTIFSDWKVLILRPIPQSPAISLELCVLCLIQRRTAAVVHFVAIPRYEAVGCCERSITPILLIGHSYRELINGQF